MHNECLVWGESSKGRCDQGLTNIEKDCLPCSLNTLLGTLDCFKSDEGG